MLLTVASEAGQIYPNLFLSVRTWGGWNMMEYAGIIKHQYHPMIHQHLLTRSTSFSIISITSIGGALMHVRKCKHGIGGSFRFQTWLAKSDPSAEGPSMAVSLSLIPAWNDRLCQPPSHS